MDYAEAGHVLAAYVLRYERKGDAKRAMRLTETGTFAASIIPAASDSDSSCPALCRASMSFLLHCCCMQDVDGRDKPAMTVIGHHPVPLV
jgi:hypothetical protein